MPTPLSLSPYWFQSPLGWLKLSCCSQYLHRIEFGSVTDPIAASSGSALHAEVVRQLQAYFSHQLQQFSLPLNPAPSAFQQRLRAVLIAIPYGSHLTYGAAAKVLQTSAQGLGQACRSNPLPIIVPCHRIVAATGIGGYNGQRDGHLISIKQRLLEHERYN